MDPSNYTVHEPSSTLSPLMYNFLNVSPPISPHHPYPMLQVLEPTMHCCANFMQLQRQHLEWFWQEQMHELGHLAVHEQHQLPLARIKKTMKLNANVKMVSAESPIVLSKACELFISELTLRSWLHVEEQRRGTILRSDIANAVIHSDMLDFLIDIVQIDGVETSRLRASLQ